MKTALLALALLAACPGRNGFTQEPGGDKGKGRPQDKSHARASLGWEQLARHSGLMELKARTQAEFRVDALFTGPAQLSHVRAEIPLTAAEQAHFTAGGARIGLFSRWVHGKMDPMWQELVGSGPVADGVVDASRIPVENHHIAMVNDEAGECRLYVLAPGTDGKAGRLFYFYRIQKPKPATAEDAAKDPFAN